MDRAELLKRLTALLDRWKFRSLSVAEIAEELACSDDEVIAILRQIHLPIVSSDPMWRKKPGYFIPCFFISRAIRRWEG